MSSKKKKVEQFLQISVHTDIKSTKEASSQQKPQNQSIRNQRHLPLLPTKRRWKTNRDSG